MTFSILLIHSWGGTLIGRAATQSQVQVSLTPTDDESAVPPVDPDNPSKPYPGDSADAGNVTGTGSQGQLTIDYVSNLKFNATTTQRGPVQTTAENQRAMVQVTDRRSTGAGWTLQVTPSPLQSRQRTLSTTLNLGTVHLQAGAGNVSMAPQVVNTTDLKPGMANNVLVADQHSGLGTWLLVLNRGTQPTTLTINDQQLTAGNYTGRLAWSLTNAPN
ncbi:WxL domain-containing protein [Lactiplantibacillus garii]|nr:WxL domain-containing protein [Lactiplantibacillus garii]